MSVPQMNFSVPPPRLDMPPQPESTSISRPSMPSSSVLPTILSSVSAMPPPVVAAVMPPPSLAAKISRTSVPAVMSGPSMSAAMSNRSTPAAVTSLSIPVTMPPPFVPAPVLPQSVPIGSNLTNQSMQMQLRPAPSAIERQSISTTILTQSATATMPPPSHTAPSAMSSRCVANVIMPPSVPAAMPPSQMYSVPPYYSLPSTDQPPPYVPIVTLPPLNVPPPVITYPVNFCSVPPPLHPTYSMASDTSHYSSINYPGTYSSDDTFTVPPPKYKCQVKYNREHSYSSGVTNSYSHERDKYDHRSPERYSRSHSSRRSPCSSGSKSPIRSERSPSRRLHSGDRKPTSSGYRSLSLSENSPCSHGNRPSSHSSSSHSINKSSSSRTNRSPYHSTHRSPSRSSHRSPSRSSHRSPSRSSYRSPSRSSHRSPSRTSLKDKERYYDRRERRRHESDRRPSPPTYRDIRNYRSISRTHDYYDDRRSHRSPSRSSQQSRHNSSKELSQSSRNGSSKPLTDREKILEEYRKNYCKTSDDLIEKMQKWSKEHNSEDEEASKMWYRSSPADLYYKPVENGTDLEQTNKLEQICEIFFEKLILRGRRARPEVDELPPLNTPKGKMCKHHSNDKSSSSSSESEDDCLDDEGLQGFTDKIMFELQRKQSHPRRLHPEMWFNNTGEMNGGLLCRCSARARRQGMRHGVYAGEGSFPKCINNQNNIGKLYHYRITVSPPTNFLIKSPTIIAHDEHEFLFSGFSMFSHYKLGKLPTCKVIRFNIEYTILYVEEPAPVNFTIKELDLFEEFLFYELLELVDLDLGKATENSCSQFHFMPRFVRYLPESGCEVLSMCEVLKYLIDESGLLIPPENLENVHAMDHYTWQKFVDKIKGMIVTYPGKKPCSVRVDQLDRSPPNGDTKDIVELNKYFPEIVHFGIRPPQLSYAGNPEYQKAWRYYVKYRHLIANMAKPSLKERQKLAAKEATLQEMRTQSKMKRDVTVAISSEGFHTTGLMCDIVQHAMLIPVLVKHLRFHKSLDCLEQKMDYVFKQRALLQTALTHPSYRENFGTNPDHARNSLTNCGIRQPEYGDRRIHYTRKKGIVTLINIMSRFGKVSETESEIKHNERLEFLGDAVVEFLSSIHLFRMFPGLAEGGLATYRASIVQNQHLAHLAKNIGLEQFMLYAHGSDLCRDVVMRHAMANCFEALMGALFLDTGLEVSVADRVFALALWHNEPDMLQTWMRERSHPLQEQEPLGDRQYIADIEFLQKLTKFEDSIGLQFKHIRLLARAFTDRSVGFTHLTLGSNQRLEFLGDTVLQLVVSDRLYRHFPDHHEGHLSLLRSSLVNNRTQAMVCDDLNMAEYATYNNPKAKPTTKKHKADLLEAFLGALYIDKNLEYCQAFCNACLFPRLQEFIMNQDWNDPKSKLQQCCLTLRSMEGGEPDIPVYKVIECLGPTNTRVYTVGVYFRGKRLAAARGHSIQEAEMNAAEEALRCAHELFPQLDHQKRVIAKSLPKKKSRKGGRDSPTLERNIAIKRKRIEDKVPKAYKLEQNEMNAESSDESIGNVQSDDDIARSPQRNYDDSGLDSDEGSSTDDKYDNVQVSSLLNDMHRLRDEMILKNEYEKLKEKCKKLEADE